MKNDNFDVSKFHFPRWEELPNIDLYMDQVLNYISDSLSSYINDENLITKTMINNYVKKEVIGAPIKKKYSKICIAELLVICILKQVYSINDIKNLIALALKTSPADVCYNKFCDVLEESLNSTFNGTVYSSDEHLSKEQYILKNVVQSFVNKLYVQVKYLKRGN